MSARGVLWASLLMTAAAWGQEDQLHPIGIEAVQERSYKMSLEFDLGFGTAPIDPFTKSYYPHFAAVLHFSDAVAWQIVRAGFASLNVAGSGTVVSFNANSQLRDQLERDFAAPAAAFEEIQYFLGTDVIWAPFYGKSSVLNRTVVNYEAFFILGLSVFKFTKDNTIPFVPDAPGLNFGGGVRLFHTQHVSTRLDVTNTFGTTFKGVYNVLMVQLSIAFNVGTSE